MLKRSLFTIFVIILLGSISLASNYSALSKIELSKLQTNLKQVKGQKTPPLISVFLSADDSTLSLLKKQGVKVNARFDSLVTAQVPLSLLSHLDGVKQLSIAHSISLCNDSAIYFSNGLPAITGEGFDKSYTGKGVIVGMIDVGFDFNHINFLDSLENPRFVRVYMPADNTGFSPIVDGDTLPGSEYVTSDQIKSLTTDDPANIHASHTTGTAVGSYMGNAYHGVAPEAEIVACGMPDSALTDVNIANSLKYIFNYADKVGKPCVVNMSIGDFEGPHDGSSDLCRLFDKLSGNGKVCVLSAGNDGNKTICIHKAFASSSDTLSTCLSNRWYGYNISGALSIWSSDSIPFSMRYKILNRSTGSVYYTSPFISSLSADSVFKVSSETDSNFAKYFTGTMLYTNAVESNGKFHAIFEADAKYVMSTYAIELQFVSPPGSSLRGWGSSNMRFVTYGLNGLVAGDNSMSISDLATGDSTITVGAYYSRCLPTVISGVNATITNGSHPTDITAFSSYGPDVNGHNHPDIVAPGHALVSSYSRYNTSMSTNNNWLCCNEVVNGVTYPYGIDTGTSMSAPVVTGSIALWLQRNPTLSPAKIKQVLKKTALRDDWVINGDSVKWGYGKLDISAGLKAVKPYLIGDINGDGVVNVSDLTELVSAVLDLSKSGKYDLNADGNVDVSDVAFLINLILTSKS